MLPERLARFAGIQGIEAVFANHADRRIPGRGSSTAASQEPTETTRRSRHLPRDRIACAPAGAWLDCGPGGIVQLSE